MSKKRRRRPRRDIWSAPPEPLRPFDYEEMSRAADAPSPASDAIEEEIRAEERVAEEIAFVEPEAVPPVVEEPAIEEATPDEPEVIPEPVAEAPAPRGPEPLIEDPGHDTSLFEWPDLEAPFEDVPPRRTPRSKHRKRTLVVPRKSRPGKHSVRAEAPADAPTVEPRAEEGVVEVLAEESTPVEEKLEPRRGKHLRKRSIVLPRPARPGKHSVQAAPEVEEDASESFVVEAVEELPPDEGPVAEALVDEPGAEEIWEEPNDEPFGLEPSVEEPQPLSYRPKHVRKKKVVFPKPSRPGKHSVGAPPPAVPEIDETASDVAEEAHLDDATPDDAIPSEPAAIEEDIAPFEPTSPSRSDRRKRRKRGRHRSPDAGLLPRQRSARGRHAIAEPEPEPEAEPELEAETVAEADLVTVDEEAGHAAADVDPEPEAVLDAEPEPARETERNVSVYEELALEMDPTSDLDVSALPVYEELAPDPEMELAFEPDADIEAEFDFEPDVEPDLILDASDIEDDELGPGENVTDVTYLDEVDVGDDIEDVIVLPDEVDEEDDLDAYEPLPRRARRRRRQRRGRFLAAFLAALVSAAATFGIAETLESEGERPDRETGPIAAGEVVPVEQPTTTLVYAIRENAERRGPIWLTLVTHDPTRDRGSAIYIPAHLASETPGRGLLSLSEGWVSGGPSLLLSSTENLLGLQIDRYVELSDNDAELLFDKIGPLTVDVPTEVTVPEGSSQTRLIFDEGPQELSPELLVELLYVRGFDVDDAELGSRILSFWDALFESFDGDGAQLAKVITQTGAALQSDASTDDVAGFFASVVDAPRDNRILATLPVRPIAAGDSELYSTELEELSALLKDAVGDVSSSEDDVRVQILNGNGEPGIGTEVADRLIGEGFRVILSGNARNFDYETTLIVTYDDSSDGERLAERARELLGVGEVQVSAQRQGSVDLTIVVGKDFLRAP